MKLKNPYVIQKHEKMTYSKLTKVSGFLLLTGLVFISGCTDKQEIRASRTCELVLKQIDGEMVALTKFTLAYPVGRLEECHRNLNCDERDYRNIYCPVIWTGVQWDKCTGDVDLDNCIQWNVKEVSLLSSPV